MRPARIEVSPECHEAMRLLARAPRGAVLQTHDDYPVRVNPKMIGPNAWRVVYRHSAPVPEKMIDAARQ
jgi:hypothetical protein